MSKTIMDMNTHTKMMENARKIEWAFQEDKLCSQKMERNLRLSTIKTPIF